MRIRFMVIGVLAVVLSVAAAAASAVQADRSNAIKGAIETGRRRTSSC